MLHFAWEAIFIINALGGGYSSQYSNGFWFLLAVSGRSPNVSSRNQDNSLGSVAG